MPKVKTLRILSILSFVIGVVCLMYLPTQDDFYYIFGFYTLAFLGYFGFTRKEIDFKLLLISGIVIRVLLFGAFPNLSDDIFRFYWDGKLIWNGINPYASLPSSLDLSVIDGLDKDLFDRLNSPHYYTIYPPLAQMVYFISSLAGIDLSVVLIRLFILGADVLALFGIMRIVSFLNLPKVIGSLYFLNPLLMIEGVGNLHFEGMMVAFVIWGVVHFFIEKKAITAAGLFAMAIGVKLLPLMFLPYFLFSNFRSKWKFLFGVGLFCILIFSPLLMSLDFPNLWTSIDLYFRKFEFNASVYYVLRAIGRYVSGYNLIRYIGPILALLTILYNFMYAKKIVDYDMKSFLKYGFLVFVGYLFLATTVHPWYLILPLSLGLLSQNRWIIGWTFLIYLSYANYYGPGYYESMPVIAIEYAILLGLILAEARSRKITD